MSYWIVTDAGCDLPLAYVQSHEKLRVISMPYGLDDREQRFGPGDEENMAEFYQKLNEGHTATTSQISTADYYAVFKELVREGESLIYISLSSGLSGSIGSAVIARDMLHEEFPDAKVGIVDSLLASMGQGLLVHYALKGREEGKDLDTLLAWLTDIRPRLNAWFTVDDLNFLFRGGRVTRTTAFFGSVLRIKPVLHMDEEGRLIPMDKVQGRKRSLRELADKTIATANPQHGQTVFISHGHCEEDAKLVAKLIGDALPDTAFFISSIGSVIGTHSGPGTVAVFFLADQR